MNAHQDYTRPGWLLALLYFGYLLSFADRAIFALALPDLRAAHGFSDRELGILSGAAFAVCYAGIAPIAGWLADRYERRLIFTVSVALWSLATAGTAIASTFWEMFAARALVGVGEGGLMLLAVSLLSDTRRGASRDHALSLFISAGAVGNVCALVFGGGLMRQLQHAPPMAFPILGTIAPWQSIFLAAGAIGVVFSAIIFTTMLEPERSKPSAAVDGGSDASTMAFIRSHTRLLFTLYIGFSVVQMATVAIGVWMVAVLSRQHGLSAGEAGMLFGSTGGVAAIIGAMSFGKIIAAVRRRGYPDAPILVCLVTGAVFAALLIAAVLTTNTIVSLSLLTISMLLVYGPTIASYVMMGEMLPPAAKAKLAGVNTLSNALISNTLGALVVGWLSDKVFTGNSGLAISLGVTVGGAIFLGLVIVGSGRASYRRRMTEIERGGSAQ